ncbi:hypothetical protein CA54_08970 [Symmachiella macrocystis]|uniref:Toprim domain-containing protein n=1 Tax=Symmachiella macrocystis TaxID=2527985 RepID=A0A5C6BLT1_9PLAN|nr:hypothetical protein [Symmachiella macrocystis]TWU12079.1 hypothetical protein CA54_08970 [Symmachiella macrocystis]
MVSPADNWMRVSHGDPCPVCGKPDNCSVSNDRKVLWCGRVSDGALRMNAGGQYLHRLDDDPYDRNPPPPVRIRPSTRSTSPTQDWPALAERFANGAEEHRQRLANQLGVTATALASLSVGWNVERFCWTFPERDASGQIIGIATRRRDGSKIRMKGGRSGLTYATDWNAGAGPILLVEGGSDTAALLTIGLNTVGRPSNCGGVDHLVGLLSGIDQKREIIVIGERDEKLDGKWPGRDGAVRTAKRLADELERPIAWALPPDNAKDARGWLNVMPELPVDRLADLFVSGLETTVISPPIVIRPPKPTGPAVAVDDWRDQMLQVRLRSLGCPGVYIDASTTGAGKSHVDLAVILWALRRRNAV